MRIRLLRISCIAAWLTLALLVARAGRCDDVTIDVRADHVIGHVSRHLTGACIEDVNHEIYGGIYSQMIFGESFQEPAPAPTLPLKEAEMPRSVSGMWRPFVRGKAAGKFTIVRQRPFVGAQSQQVVLESGEGELGIENRGLNRWGMSFVAGKPYEGYVWLRAEKPTILFAALESGDGSETHAEQSLKVAGDEWQRIDFSLTPGVGDKAGRFALKLKQPGSVAIGHAFLQPGEWGRFKGLPVRRDVADGLINQGISVLRYGGSMVNNSGYKWKNMIGPRDRRPPYSGTWYRYSSNGWGIPEFMSFCEAAGFEYIPDFYMGETPQDMADFIDYAQAPADSEWGRKRTAGGHPAPYRLRYMELGNEERVDEKYAEKFEAVAAAIWAKDPKMILVVGDFAFHQPINDPFHFAGADSGITTLAAQQRILRFAKRHDREVWFDVHVWTDHPEAANASLIGMLSFTDALAKVADGARHRVAVFELNSGNHSQKRALANALAINAIERDGRSPIVCSANGLQPDKQNDNGWDQGLLFLNPSQVWLQPPGYLTQIQSANYLPQLVQCDVGATANLLDANAKRSEDGKTLVLQIVNPSEQDLPAQIKLSGFVPAQPTVKAIELSGPLEGANAADKPDAIVPKQTERAHGLKGGRMLYTLPAHSFTVLRFE